MPEATLKKIALLAPHARLQQIYGLSELGVLRSRSEDSDSLWVKIGGAGFETRITDGILYVRSESAMIGYLNAPSPFSAFLDDHRYMRFKLAFIDCGVRDVITKSLECLWPRLVKGGILVMDHYNTAVSPLESELVEKCIGDRPVQKMSFSRQPTAYIEK